MIKCPECEHEITGKECPACSKDTPPEGIYCMYCGERLENDSDEASYEDDDFDFENRVLCSDGSCTGIIIDGKCSECGKAQE